MTMHDEVLARCRAALPGWAALTVDDVEFDPPKGFSSFTMGVRPSVPVDPPAVLYRHLEGKENAILSGPAEEAVFLMLGDAGVAARCLHHEEGHRIEEFYTGRTITAAEVRDPVVQKGIADQLHALHQLDPAGLPEGTFFELLHQKWGPLARRVLEDHRDEFPAHEQALFEDLQAIHEPATLDKVRRLLPEGDPVFCHNDTYHGNIFLLADGRIRLLDFEFSCRNHIAFDFANVFAETVMIHGLADPPHFRIGDPPYTVDDIARLIGFYVDNLGIADADERRARVQQLVHETQRAIAVSDYMYAMAALPLAVDPIQKIRFIPYAHQRLMKFLAS